MPKVTFLNNMFFEGSYYKAGKTYTVTGEQATALGTQVKVVLNPLAKTTVPAKKATVKPVTKDMTAPPKDKMIKAAPKSKSEAKRVEAQKADAKQNEAKVDVTVNPSPVTAGTDAPTDGSSAPATN